MDLTIGYIDGLEVGPQDWDAAFLEEITSRLPELRKRPEHARQINLLNRIAGIFWVPAINDDTGHAEPP